MKNVQSGDPARPVRVSGGVIAGSLLKKVAPTFPPRVDCPPVSGVVVMHAVIGKDGHVESVEAISGAEVMRQPNIDAVRQWIYKPFLLNGEPVEVDTTVTNIVDFNGGDCATDSRAARN